MGQQSHHGGNATNAWLPKLFPDLDSLDSFEEKAWVENNHC